MRPLLLVALLSAPALADPAVLLFPAVGTPAQVTLSGRVLKHRAPAGGTALGRNLRRLTSSNWPGAVVEVRFAGRATRVTAGHDGNFRVTFAAADGAPFATGFALAQAHVAQVGTATATVDVVGPAAPYFVISDFDDTVAVTRVTEKAALVRAALLQDEATQPAVEGMAALYGCLRGEDAERRAFAFVSGSPLQYSGRVTQFLSRHGFPQAGLYLRDLGPSTLSDYKPPLLRALLSAVPTPVVLVGDSGEKDPEVYRQLRDEFPGRVKAIYIRDAGRADDARRFEGMRLFTHPREAAADALEKGLVSAGCVARAFPEEPR